MGIFSTALRCWQGILVGLLILAGVLLGYQTFRNHQAAPRTIPVTGTIEATQVEVTAKYTGRIVALPVREGAAVRQGDLLVTLDDAELKAEVSRLDAALGAARAQLRDLLAGARKEEVDEAKASVDRARAQLDDLMAGGPAPGAGHAGGPVHAARATR